MESVFKLGHVHGRSEFVREKLPCFLRRPRMLLLLAHRLPPGLYRFLKVFLVSVESGREDCLSGGDEVVKCLIVDWIARRLLSGNIFKLSACSFKRLYFILRGSAFGCCKDLRFKLCCGGNGEKLLGRLVDSQKLRLPDALINREIRNPFVLLKRPAVGFLGFDEIALDPGLFGRLRLDLPQRKLNKCVLLPSKNHCLPKLSFCLRNGLRRHVWLVLTASGICWISKEAKEPLSRLFVQSGWRLPNRWYAADAEGMAR